MGELLKRFREGNEAGLGLNGDYRDPSIFYPKAEALLQDAREEVYDEFIPNLERQQGTWHPLGFMAWKLGRLESLGVLRMDMWPAGFRQESPRGPKIHDHTWHLSSLVLDGTYEDTLYSVEEVDQKVLSEEERQRQNLLRVFRPSYSKENPGLVTDGTCAIVEPIEGRTIEAGGMHTIDTGVFHTTTIPMGRLAATLVLESPAIHKHPRILMDTPMDPLSGAKLQITEEEATRAKEQLLR